MERGPPVFCNEDAETLACRRVVEFALECGFREMVVEGDNLSVMSALELKKSLSSRVGHIIQDVLCLLMGSDGHSLTGAVYQKERQYSNLPFS